MGRHEKCYPQTVTFTGLDVDDRERGCGATDESSHTLRESYFILENARMWRSGKNYVNCARIWYGNHRVVKEFGLEGGGRDVIIV
jgi:hypothetical protein